MIDKKFIEDIEEIVGRENVLLDEPMSKHTSFRTGGNAEIYINVCFFGKNVI